MPEVWLFAGPSAFGVPPSLLLRPGLKHRPAARRGDIEALLSEEPGVVVLCDGVFQSEPAVSHAELCRVLDAGWQVWGVSSLGAIRAHEMRHEGMQGFGWVYGQFERHRDFTDDEMALLHLPMPPFAPLTEALVNLRYALARRGPALGIAQSSGRAAVEQLRGLWFGDRTQERLYTALVEAGGVDEVSARRLLAWMVRRRVKTLDLLALLRSRPWRSLDMATTSVKRKAGRGSAGR